MYTLPPLPFFFLISACSAFRGVSTDLDASLLHACATLDRFECSVLDIYDNNINI